MGSLDETTKLQYTWILWYHDPEIKDYSLESYVRVAEIGTPQQFWTVIEAIPKEAWECGMYFFLRRGFRPQWEVPENENGGAWSKKIDASQIHTTLIDLMVHSIVGELLTSRKETLTGVTVSPKGQFHIIKIWNNTTTVCDRAVLKQDLAYFKITEDVTYTAHKARPK
jgi:translation initiation factor 4E